MRGADKGKARESRSYLPTPCARDFRSPNTKPFSERGGGKKGEQLVNYVNHFLTPRATDTGKGEKSETFVARMGDRSEDCFQSLPSQVGGQLNPPWVEWLMGWPIGWTDLKPLETARFQQWPHSHSKLSNIA